MAGSLKRENPDKREDIVLIRALRDSNLPKFLKDDADLFKVTIIFHHFGHWEDNQNTYILYITKTLMDTYSDMNDAIFGFFSCDAFEFVFSVRIVSLVLKWILFFREF